MAFASTTRATLRTRISERLLSTFWSATELDLYINEALRVWNVLTGYQRNVETQTIAATTSPFYARTALTTTGIILLRIENADTHLDHVSLSEIGALAPNWISFTDTAVTGWCHVGLNQIVFNPIPGSGFDATSYYIDASPIPGSDGAFIQVGDEDLPAIVDYCVFIARLKESGSEFQESIALLQNFLKQADKYNAKLVQTSLYRRVLGNPKQPQTRPTGLEHIPPR